MGKCVMCGAATNGHVGEDPLCFEHYEDHTYAQWLQRFGTRPHTASTAEMITCPSCGCKFLAIVIFDEQTTWRCCGCGKDIIINNSRVDGTVLLIKE